MHGPGTVRSGEWKFHPWKEGSGKGRGKPEEKPSSHPLQLYDTRADIGETNNIAAENPEVVARLQAAYDAPVKEIKANQRPSAEMIRPDGAIPAGRPGGANKKNAKKSKK